MSTTSSATLQAQTELAAIGFTSVAHSMVAGSVGAVLQALVLGSCVQLVIRYFSQPKRDPTWGRIGVVWSIFIALLNAITGNIQNGLMIMNQDNFISSALRDRYFFQLEMLWVNLIHVPVLVLFTRRAWVLWDRRKIVLVVCLAPITAMAILTLVATVYGLDAPWGFQTLTQEQFEGYLPAYEKHVAAWEPLGEYVSFVQLGACSLVSVFICAGVLRHRNGSKELNTAISRIVFVCGESLFPMVILSAVQVAVVGVGGPTMGYTIRVLVLVCPTVVLHALLTSLVSRERVAAILRAEPVRNLSAYPSPTSTKVPGLLDSSGSGYTDTTIASDYTSGSVTFMSPNGRL